MIKIIKHFILLNILIFIFVSNLLSQSNSLSKASKDLHVKYLHFKENPNDSIATFDFLINFPNNVDTFLFIFNQEDFSELYDDSEIYFSLLTELEEKYSFIVGMIYIDLAKDIRKECDPCYILRENLVRFANNYTECFIKCINSLTNFKRWKVITFLADVENHQFYNQYINLIDKLEKIGKSEIAKDFIKAREERIKQIH